MALFTSLPVYKLGNDLLIDIHKITKSFTREHKYTLGEKLKEESLQLLIHIYKANKNLRLGLSWHSPSILYLSDEYQTSLDVNHSFNDSTYSYSNSSSYGTYDYLITPLCAPMAASKYGKNIN